MYICYVHTWNIVDKAIKIYFIEANYLFFFKVTFDVQFQFKPCLVFPSKMFLWLHTKNRLS